MRKKAKRCRITQTRSVKDRITEKENCQLGYINEEQVWREGGSKPIPVIYLIPLSHFSFPSHPLPFLAVSLFRLNVYLCHSKLNFYLSSLCLTPLFPPSHLHYSIFSLPPSFKNSTPSVSPIKTRYYTPSQQ